MEIETLVPNYKQTYGGIKMFMRRRRYERLNGGTGGRKIKIIRLRRSPDRYWRVRTIPMIRWVIRSPLKMLTKLKNAYMNFMLRFVGNVGALNTEKVFGEKRIIPKARNNKVSTLYSGHAFEARLIYEISKTLVASHELYPM